MVSLLGAATVASRYGRVEEELPVVPSGAVIGPGRDAVLFLWDAAPWEPETILLGTAWAIAETGDAPADASSSSASARSRAKALMALWAERAASGAPLWPFDGTSLMRDLGLAPGPELGKALRAARLAWEAGEAPTAVEALAAAREAICRP